MSELKPPFDICLPKITDEIVNDFDGYSFLRHGAGRWEWTQEAVDFAAAIVRPQIQARIAALEAENARLKAALADMTADYFRSRDELMALKYPDGSSRITLETPEKHSTEDDFQHFLSYSGLGASYQRLGRDVIDLRVAYYTGAGIDVTEPCSACAGTGEIDETLGGISTSDPHAPCPDCTPKTDGK